VGCSNLAALHFTTPVGTGLLPYSGGLANMQESRTRRGGQTNRFTISFSYHPSRPSATGHRPCRPTAQEGLLAKRLVPIEQSPGETLSEVMASVMLVAGASCQEPALVRCGCANGLELGRQTTAAKAIAEEAPPVPRRRN
jgi:hypothetical protein